MLQRRSAGFCSWPRNESARSAFGPISHADFPAPAPHVPGPLLVQGRLRTLATGCDRLGARARTDREIVMPHLRRPLYQRSDGADEDCWRLVFDTDARRLFVEHEAKRGDMRGSGYGIHTDEIDI